MANMFQQPSRPAGHVHVEFKAGRMDWDGKKVTAQKTKGKLILLTAEEEGLMHLQWHDREKNEMVVDLIVINDAYMTKIPKCTDGDVYILRFTSSDKKMFFWLQESNKEKNEELIKKFNEEVGATIPDKAKPPAGSPAAPAAPATATAAAPGADLDPATRAILAQFLEAQAQQGPRTPPIPLSAVLTTEVLQELIKDEAAATEMTSLLPSTHQTPEGLREAVTSAQLQQSLHSLSQAIHSDQLPVLMASLGISQSAIASAEPGTDALEVLCRAMQGGNNGGGGSAGGGSA